jgi:SRSO17 transposase
LELIDQTAASGIEIETWTFDENYGRDCGFLDGLDDRKCAYVGEVPPNFRVWIAKPKVLRKPPKNRPKCGKRYPRLAARDAKASSVKNLAKYSPAFTEQTPQRYRVTDSHKGPEIWEVQWHTCWRKSHSGKLVSSQCTLIVAKNVRTGEVKYFLSNRVPGRGGWTLRAILRVAFSRWKVEACFREAKKELGWDHFECRGWGCVHRHLIVTILSQLFCARMRHRLCRSEVVTDAQLLTLEQVRRAADVYLDSIELPRSARYQAELDRLRYHQTRNATASRSHRKTRLLEYEAIGIDVMKIKSVEPKTP